MREVEARVAAEMVADIRQAIDDTLGAHGFQYARHELNRDWETVDAYYHDPIRRDWVAVSVQIEEDNLYGALYFAGGNAGDPDDYDYDMEPVSWGRFVKDLPGWLDLVGDECPECDGEGLVYDDEDDEKGHTCPVCCGTGRVRPERAA